MPGYEGIPQLEDGFARIANEILEAIARTPLSDYESRCVHFLWRKTYGWQNPSGDSKKVDVISHTQWARSTGIPRRHINRVLTRLAKRNIITKGVIYQGTRRIILWGFQKRYKEWLSPKEVTNRIQPSPNEVTEQVSPKQEIGKAKVSPKEVTNRIQPSPIQGKVSPKEVTQLSPKQVHTKDSKDTSIKDSLLIRQEEKKILEVLKSLPGWKYNQKEDLAWLHDLMDEFNNVSYFNLKSCREYHSDKIAKKGPWKNRIRQWLKHEMKFEKGGRNGELEPKSRQERRRPIKYIRDSGKLGPEAEEDMP